MNGNSKIEFTTHNIDGKKYSVSTTVVELLRDWYGDCSMVPENDTEIQKVRIDGEYPLELCKTANNRMAFGKFMRMIEGCLKPVASNIEWDLDDIEEEAEKDAVNENILPQTAEIPANVAGEGDDAITEYLSDTYGYCVKGYALVWKDSNLHDIKG